MPESYWSNRSNLINKYFVKIGWFWTTIVFIIYAILIHTNKLEQFVKAIIRLLLASLYWYLFTQWLFGPSLLDRVFVFTGGECSKVSKVVPGEIFEAHVCRKGGGDWNNGHDVSGHCFMLIHASLFILEDANILFYRSNNWKNKFLFKLFGGLLFLWWWMLLMTAVYFHTFFEKFTGTLSGLFYWALIYGFIFPKYMPYMMPYELEGYKFDKKSLLLE
ncbi:8469_t:CDS:1 [Funneliformis mosseae]|uniref:8469_t:CDS:1 n=1 Tax=Funneliformis mosseae TaxID=27381 RepID=A0A9N8V0V7_FUNMO|nr:8469_t:CDS:1 [Funneliformis mosseae]